MRYALLDTNVYIDLWTGALPSKDLSAVRKAFIVRQSSVVLSELLRGARTTAARRLVESVKRIGRGAWAPTADDWWAAGALIRSVGDAHDWDIGKRRDFQNDVLIALTARRQGATVVTRNRADFELLTRHLQFRLMIV